MQNSILLLVDVEAVLAEGTMQNNCYLVDNTRALGSRDEGRETMMSSVVGVHHADGSLAAEAVLNWISGGISALPPTLPRSYHLRHGHGHKDTALVGKLAAAKDAAAVADILKQHEQSHGALGASRPNMPHLPVDPRDAKGNFLDPSHAEYAAHISPAIIAVRGEAVEKEVIFPALYGSPDFFSEGWYWSATVDTGKVGIHSYILDVQILRPIRDENGVQWHPEVHSIEAKINVVHTVEINAFTGAVWPGVLPLCPAPVSDAPAAIEGAI